MHVPFHGFYYSHPCLGLCCICARSYKLSSSPTYHGYSLQSSWVPQFLLRTHNPHVLVLQVIYALTCRTLQVLIALLLHTPRAMLVVAIWAWEGLWWVSSVEALFGMEPSMFLQHNKYDGDERAMPIGEQAWDVSRLILWSSLSTWAHVTFVPHSYQSSLFMKFILTVLQIFTHMRIWAALRLSRITWQKPDKDVIFFSQSAFHVLLSHALPLTFNPSTCALKLWIPKGDSITPGICWPVTNLCHLKHITNIWSKHPISIWLSIHVWCFLGGHGSLYDCEWRCAVNVFQN